MANLIFILSLPRSGSTLLQRILAGHDEIDTVAEPWFMLPLMYMTRKKSVYAEFSWESLANAMQDLIASLPNGEADYFDAIRNYSDTIYGKLNKGKATYFLDKTPRYYFIIEELYKLYPDAKYLFLFRHPLSIYSSVMHSFNNGKLGNVRHRIDVEQGPHLLASGYQLLKDRSFALRFEDFVAQPEKQLRILCRYLEIDFKESLIDLSRGATLNGKMGDSIGTKLYSTINKKTSQKWRATFSTPYRKMTAKRYIRSIGRRTIETIGYDYSQILNDIEMLDVNKGQFLSDIYSQVRCSFLSAVDVFIAKDRLRSALRNGRKLSKMFPHS